MTIHGAPIEAAAPAAAASSQEARSQEARAFLARLYAGYARRGGRGAPLDRPAALFEPVLAAAMARDAARANARQEVGTLDFDPFCAGQDWEPFTPRIGPLQIAGSRAQATVRFSNGRPVTLRIALVRTAAGWRVYDVSGTDLAGGLRAMFVHPR